MNRLNYHSKNRQKIYIFDSIFLACSEIWDWKTRNLNTQFLTKVSYFVKICSDKNTAIKIDKKSIFPRDFSTKFIAYHSENRFLGFFGTIFGPVCTTVWLKKCQNSWVKLWFDQKKSAFFRTCWSRTTPKSFPYPSLTFCFACRPSCQGLFF